MDVFHFIFTGEVTNDSQKCIFNYLYIFYVRMGGEVPRRGGHGRHFKYQEFVVGGQLRVSA